MTYDESREFLSRVKLGHADVYADISSPPAPELTTGPSDFLSCFIPGVKETGFDLKRLDQEQGAGLIDDQLRVRLNTARFVIADITDSNVNVFWEAEFAEGQRKPVMLIRRPPPRTRT